MRIKPSFGFKWALRNACLSSYVRGVHPDRATWQH
jgi:hypothetical protein